MPARRTPEQKATLSLVEINASDWPPTVKARAKAVLKLTVDLREKNKAVAATDMMAPEKVGLMNEVGELHMRLATECRNLSKELAYHISHINKQNNG